MKSDIYNEIHRLQPFGNSSFVKTLRRAPFVSILRRPPSHPSIICPSNINILPWAWLIQRVWTSRPINLLSLHKITLKPSSTSSIHFLPNHFPLFILQILNYFKHLKMKRYLWLRNFDGRHAGTFNCLVHLPWARIPPKIPSTKVLFFSPTKLIFSNTPHYLWKLFSLLQPRIFENFKLSTFLAKILNSICSNLTHC